MRRWFILPALIASALAFAAAGAAEPGPGKGKGKGHEFVAKGGKLTLQVTTTDHGCNFRPWATDKLSRTFFYDLINYSLFQRQNLLQLGGRYGEQAHFGQALGEGAPIRLLLKNGF